jgi:Abscisic acid G-protein coupled receptor
MAWPIIRCHAPWYWVLLHLPHPYRTFLQSIACTLLPLINQNQLCQSLSNILLPVPTPTTPTDSHPSPDLIASTLLLLIPHPSPTTEVNVTYATRQVNLVLVGVVIIGSIRRVLQGAARALRATPASRNRIASLVLLALAQLMARALLSYEQQMAGLTTRARRWV